MWKNQCVTTRANELANSILKTVKLLGNDCFPMYLEINEMNNLFCLFWQYCCQAFKQNIFTSVKLCSCYLLNIFINNVIEIYNLTCFLSTLNISFPPPPPQNPTNNEELLVSFLWHNLWCKSKDKFLMKKSFQANYKIVIKTILSWWLFCKWKTKDIKRMRNSSRYIVSW